MCPYLLELIAANGNVFDAWKRCVIGGCMCGRVLSYFSNDPGFAGGSLENLRREGGLSLEKLDSICLVNGVLSCKGGRL